MSATLPDLAESVRLIDAPEFRSRMTVERMRTDTYLPPNPRYTAERQPPGRRRAHAHLREPVRTSAGTCPSCGGHICAMTGTCRCSR